MSVTSVSSASTVAQGTLLSADQKAKAMAAKMVKEFDTNQDGSLDQDEFVNGMVSKGMSKSDATSLFDAIDSKKTGKVTTSDLAAAIKSGKLKSAGTQHSSSDTAQASSAKGTGGASGSASSAKGAKAGGGGGSSASSTQYDPADTNKDGVVEAAEELIYEQKHPQAAEKAAEKKAAAAVSTTTTKETLGTHVDELV